MTFAAAPAAGLPLRRTGRGMPRDGYDVVIVGGGSAGCALANRLSADPSTRVLVLEAGRSDYPWDVFIHMPAALTFPSGSRFYDWRYESEPEPHMGGRRIPHARGKVLGGSSSINGMIFQRGNPLDYERWAADPGMGTWDYAHCLPYFIRMENCLAAEPDDEFRGHSGPLVLERGPGHQPAVRRVPAGGAGGGLPADRRRQRVPPGGLRPLRPQRPPRAAAVRGPRVPASRDVPAQPRRPHGRPGDEGGTSTAPAPSASSTRHWGRPVRRVDAGEIVLCGGAINTPQLLQLSGSATRTLLRPLGIPVVADLPGVGENLQDHLEVYVQHALHAAGVDAALPGQTALARHRLHGGSSCAAAPAPPTTSRRAASSAATTTSTTRT